jgi:hypothetical protein
MRRVRIAGIVMLLAMGLGAGVLAGRGAAAAGAIGAPAPDIAGGGPWIGSAPLTMAGLRGRVVLVEFWTYG